MKYDFIIADPPWMNKSAKRKKSYVCVDTDDVLASLPIPSLLNKGGLVSIWLSNKASVHHKTEEILKSWGLVKIAMWHWLKVCTSNKPIVEFGKPEHKVPFESMLFACLPEDLPLFTSTIRNNFCVISVPNANPSRKPPVAEILCKLNMFRGSNALELFARYLLPSTTSIGFECLKFQDEYFYEFGFE